MNENKVKNHLILPSSDCRRQPLARFQAQRDFEPTGRGTLVTSRLLVRVEISGGGDHSAPQCLTCSLRPDRCQYSFAYFSSNASFYRVDCYGQLNTALKSSDVGVLQLRSPKRHFEDATCTRDFPRLFLFSCVFLSLPGPGLPIFTLMDSRGSGIHLHRHRVLKF